MTGCTSTAAVEMYLTVALLLCGTWLAPLLSANGDAATDFLKQYTDPKVSHIQVSGDVYLSDDLPLLSRSLTIVGVKQTGGRLPTLDGRGSFSGIVTSANLTLQSLAFTNFKTSTTEGGAAVYAYGGTHVLIDKCVFRGNRAMSGRGGAVSLNDVDFSMTNCTFDRNGVRIISGSDIDVTEGLKSFSGKTSTSGQAGKGGGQAERATQGSQDGADGQWGQVAGDGEVGAEPAAGAETATGGTTDNPVGPAQVNEKTNKQDGIHGGAVACSGSVCNIARSTFTNNFSS
ncbi:hypothetical protein CBR_g39798 [Chara braunii]|uniref:Right handed beta helix domain-containing protein n=1 Tax=Chara braunii TaxID=69332 RepID=A0A388LSP7_CHABU|nr:hypothetical protein CBR_g39798 [Chara braunii]|eukprot:GBG85232.1 hypothetical protein CBR_g39798 [Chara braunii]